MSESNDVKDFFIYKTACLLHDPPTKAWNLIHKQCHKSMAKTIAQKILDHTCLNRAVIDLENIAKKADIYASSFDRWLLSIIIGQDYNRFPTTSLKLKNIFNPKYEVELDKKTPDHTNFAHEINNALRNVADPCLAYHVLYALYEAEWILQDLPSGPADTRAPSHTVFDHNYATASIANWLYQTPTPSGILLLIDLGGVQKFINDSRKLIDLWASSYLASALTWSILWTFVKDLGPDVAIIPTCRGNPFYYHSLIAELRKIQNSEQLIDKIKRIAKTLTGYDADTEVFPNYAVVPATASLILPQIKTLSEFDGFTGLADLADLEKFVQAKYQESWKAVYDTVVDITKSMKDNSFLQGVASKLDESREFGFDTVPPLPLQVIAVSTDKITQQEGGDKAETRYKLYHKMFELLNQEKNQRKIYRPCPEENLKLYEMTSSDLATFPSPSRRGFDYCSVCGRLPAVIVMPSREEEYPPEWRKWEPVFGVGEKLCPYCLVKRLMIFGKIKQAVIEKLLGKVSHLGIEKTSTSFIITNHNSFKLAEIVRRQIRFPSVSDVAAQPFVKTILRIAERADGETALAEELAKELIELLQQFKSITPRSVTIEVKTLTNQNLRNVIELVISADAESLFFANRRSWIRLINKIKENKFFETIEIDELNTYYAILRSDGDSFGQILTGSVQEGVRLSVEQYLVDSLEGDAKAVIELLLNDKIEEAQKIAKDVDINQLKELKKLLDEQTSTGKIVVSPSYHAAVSRALMVNAVQDSKIIEEHDGIIIYTGGDDLLAIMPVKNSLRAVGELRQSFSHPRRNELGFRKFGNFMLPSLACASRSFCVYYTHYMFPLYTALKRALNLLKSRAKKVVWRWDAYERKKDSVVLCYSPRGGEALALLPLFDIAHPHQLGVHVQQVSQCIESIESNKPSFSVSLIYDLQKTRQTIQTLIEQGNQSLFEYFVAHVFERNGRGQADERRRNSQNWMRYLSQNRELCGELDDRKTFFVTEWISALRVFRSGLRGVE